MDSLIKADIAHELHVQAEMFLDNLTDQISDHWIILLSKLIDHKPELESLQNPFNPPSLLGINFFQHVQ
jgi:hypothetical protein